MALSLPADIEPFLADGESWADPGVYALVLSRPADPAAAWDRAFDARPPWFDRFLDAERVAYVGATANLCARLEDHRDGEVRQATVLEVCDIDRLQTVWVFDSADDAFASEYNCAAMLTRERPEWYVHSR